MTETGWQPSDYITLTAVIASAVVAIVVAGWSHRHDRKMRMQDWDEQRKLREEARKEEMNERWLRRAQETAVSVRRALMNELDPKALSEQDQEEAKLTIRTVWEDFLRPEVQTLAAYYPDESVREAAKQIDRRVWKLFIAVGRLRAVPKRATPGHRRERRRQAQRAHGEAHYAVDTLIDLTGGPKVPDRGSYHMSLETNP